MSVLRMILCSVLLSTGAAAQAEHQAPVRDLLALDLEALLAIEIGPSADASARGLSKPFAGGQVADGGRLGFLGTRGTQDTPFSLTSYSRDFIRNQQAASVGDVLQYDSAVRVTRGFGNFQQTYMIRGLPLFSDDMAYNGLYGILPRQYLAAELIERVDVLRGASAFLNGAAPGGSGLGGAVNVMPKRAAKLDLADLTLGYQSDGTAIVAADVGRRSDDQRWGLRLNGVYREGDTAVDDESVSLKLATAGLDFRGVRNRVSIDLGVQSHHLDATTPSIDIAPDLAIPDAPDAASAIAQPWTYSKETDLFATLRAEHDFSNQLTGWIAAGIRQGEEDSNLSAFLTVFNASGDFSSNRFQVAREDDVLTGDTGLRLDLETGGVRHRVSLSANYYAADSHNAYRLFAASAGNLYQPQALAEPDTLAFAGGDINHPLRTLEQQTGSLALADQIALPGDHLQILLGLRQQHIVEETFDYSSGARLTRYDESALSPAAAVLYRLTPVLSTYLHYIEGLAKGDIAPASNALGAVANAGESLAPYHTRQLEWGVKYQAEHVGTQLALFQLRKPLAAFNQNNALVQQGSQQHRGIEWSFFGAPLDSLRWLGGISWLRTDNDGNDVIGTPGVQGNLNLEWDAPAWQGLTLTGQWMATGSQYADAANTQKVPAWHRLDLGLRQQWPLRGDTTLVLRANLHNVTGADYWSASGGFPGEGYLILGQPRAFILSTSLGF